MDTLKNRIYDATFTVDAFDVAWFDHVARGVFHVQEVTVQVTNVERAATQRVGHCYFLHADEVVTVPLEERVRLLLQDHDDVAGLVDSRLRI